jgi:hypothetical protein
MSSMDTRETFDDAHEDAKGARALEYERQEGLLGVPDDQLQAAEEDALYNMEPGELAERSEWHERPPE